MRLTRSLYGLRRPPRNWNETRDNGLLRIGFREVALSDPCVYERWSDDTCAPVCLHVNDLLYAGSIECGVGEYVRESTRGGQVAYERFFVEMKMVPGEAFECNKRGLGLREDIHHQQERR